MFKNEEYSSSIYFMHIDRMCLQQNPTQMLIGGTQYPAPGELTKYKCLVPTQNRLLNALAEEVERGLNNFRVRKTI